MATRRQIKKIYRNGVEYHIVGSNVYDATTYIKNRKGETIDSFTANQKEDKTITLPIGTLTGKGAPTSIPTEVGQFYLDSDTKTMYYAAGTSSANDWLKLVRASSGVYVVSSDESVEDLVALDSDDDYEALIDSGNYGKKTLYFTPASE